MAKSYKKLIVFGVVAGAAAAGIYHYTQKKKKETDFIDEFDKFDDNDPVIRINPKREYISLDSAKAFVNDTFEKAKGAISNVSRKFSSLPEEDADDAEVFDIIDEDVLTDEAPVAEPKKEEEPGGDNSADGETIEDFFDDDDEN